MQTAMYRIIAATCAVALSASVWAQAQKTSAQAYPTKPIRVIVNAAAGVTPARHQLLLAIGGHPDPAGPTIREMAGSLLVRHHRAVELVDRAGAAFAPQLQALWDGLDMSL